tara:strand:+ start:450 stop:797 length:348 start_codon:yes stop_codon:yes gene_type:complete
MVDHKEILVDRLLVIQLGEVERVLLVLLEMLLLVEPVELLVLQDLLYNLVAVAAVDLLYHLGLAVLAVLVVVQTPVKMEQAVHQLILVVEAGDLQLLLGLLLQEKVVMVDQEKFI